MARHTLCVRGEASLPPSPLPVGVGLLPHRPVLHVQVLRRGAGSVVPYAHSGCVAAQLAQCLVCVCVRRSSVAVSPPRLHPPHTARGVQSLIRLVFTSLQCCRGLSALLASTPHPGVRSLARLSASSPPSLHTDPGRHGGCGAHPPGRTRQLHARSGRAAALHQEAVPRDGVRGGDRSLELSAHVQRVTS